MGDLRSKPVIVAKGLLFFGIVAGAATLILLEHPTLPMAALVVVLVWASARSYYFLFYVLEKYVDPNLRYSGLFDLLAAIVRRGRRE